jgi:phosphoribosylformylglycinamidine synthase
MFNDFTGFDEQNTPVKISVPPTLLISSIGIHPDVEKAVSMDVKMEGDLVYVIGETSEELGGSEYFARLGYTGNGVPRCDIAPAKERYGKLANVISRDLVASAYPVTSGGLGIALAKAAIAGGLGMDLTIPAGTRADYYLFSESLGRFVVTIAPDNKRLFEREFGTDAHLLGRVQGTSLRITAGTTLLDHPVSGLETAYKAPFRSY